MDHSKIVNQLIEDVKASLNRATQGGKTRDYVTYAKFRPGNSDEVEIGITLLGGVEETEDARRFRQILEELDGHISVFGLVGQGCVDENAFRISGVVSIVI